MQHLDISEDALQEILRYSISESAENKEACGIIKTDGSVVQILNSAANPESNFDIRNIGYSHSEIRLIWHSHYKDDQPGEFTHSDLNLSHQTKIPILLYHAGFNEWDYYEPLNPNPWPLKPSAFAPDNIEFYTNWRFSWGRSDCFSLVRRYFLGMHNKSIKEFHRPNPEETFNTSWDANQHWSYTDNGFEAMPHGSTPQNNDIFGVALRGGKNINHLAVMVDATQNLILHNIGKNRRSRIDRYDDSWRKLVVPNGHGRLIQTS